MNELEQELSKYVNYVCIIFLRKKVISLINDTNINSKFVSLVLHYFYNKVPYKFPKPTLSTTAELIIILKSPGPL